jgi:4-amino-4-deoxy-L-arabinose transferase-like glycosyltransferase
MALPRTALPLDANSPIAMAMAYPRIALALLCLMLFTPGLMTLPPLDRDESRYTQATKQMIETGDYIEIQFQEEQRNKKPVGIYWMQALTVSMLSSAPYTDIWAYRIPSVLAAIAAVLLVFGIGARLFDRETGFAAGAILASALLVVGEAHIAKTDAVQLACIVAAQGLIARFYFAARTGDYAPGWRWSLGLWAAIGLGIIVKGPITPFVCGATAIALSIWEGRYRWIWSMRPIFGLGVMMLIVLPWLIAIMLVTEGGFLADAWGRDFAGKVVSSQEGHWGPPGYYLALLPLTFWPASLFLIPAGYFAWTRRREGAIRFLLCWILPTWAALEITTTKLPHYVLPLYPALALLAAAALSAAARDSASLISSVPARLGTALWLAITFVLAFGLLIYAPTEYGTGAGMFSYALLAAVLLAAGFAAYFMIRLEGERALVSACVAGVILVAGALGVSAPRLEQVMLSPRAAELAAKMGATGNQGEKLAIAGYSEPSLVFLAGTKVKLTNGAGAAEFLIGTPGSYAFVNQRAEDGAFRQYLTTKGHSAEAVGQVNGLNYSKGTDIVLTLYRLRKTAP